MAGSLKILLVYICFPTFSTFLQYLCCIFGSCERVVVYYTNEVLKWVNIMACSEPCTIRMADPVVMKRNLSLRNVQ